MYVDMGSCKDYINLASLITESSKKDFPKNMDLSLLDYYKGNNLNMVARNTIYTYDILSLSNKIY